MRELWGRRHWAIAKSMSILLCAGRRWRCKIPHWKLDCFEASLRELKSYRASGGTSLVDAQPVAAGRGCISAGTTEQGERRAY